MVTAAGTGFSEYLPVATSLLAFGFSVVLYRHWRRRPQARYLPWWTIGVAVFGMGTLSEASTTLLGWNDLVFRTWYISGALLGGALLAQGTVYLLLRRRTADWLALMLTVYVAVAAAFVMLTPIDTSLVGDLYLTGRVMEWQWVRAFSPLVNFYAFIFLVGGAALSAWRYRRDTSSRDRMWGNALIANGALLPAIGGGFARFGRSELLAVTELIGLSLIWLGYRVITRDRTPPTRTAPVGLRGHDGGGL